jgi:2-keto-4-pentenoate hydratase/2-oxohepta-3-ene-1,7-dioic acid hydratase in catechol pathway
MKIICIGRNYAEHAKEMSSPLPQEPVFFLKPDSCLLRNNQPFFYPKFTNELHHEIEVVIKICRLGKNISEKFAPRYYKEVALGVDFTARDLQRQCKEKGLPWEMAKAFDGSAPISQFIPIANFESIHSVDFRLEVNGKIVQQGNTADMIFDFNKIIAYVSKFMTLKTGDLIYSGTPSGVGPVSIGDRLRGYLDGKMMFDFFVR